VDVEGSNRTVRKEERINTLLLVQIDFLLNMMSLHALRLHVCLAICMLFDPCIVVS
jgi:hypothetical protein